MKLLSAAIIAAVALIAGAERRRRHSAKPTSPGAAEPGGLGRRIAAALGAAGSAAPQYRYPRKWTKTLSKSGRRAA